MDNGKLDDKLRVINSIKFYFGVFSIICGIVLILMIFYQYVHHWDFERIHSEAYPDHPEILTAFNPEFFHPEIFIPEGMILLMLGFVLLYVLKLQIRNNNKQLKYIMVGLIVSILFFSIFFIIGHVLTLDHLGRWDVINPLIGIIVAIIVICTLIFLLIFVNKLTSRFDKPSGINDELPKNLVNNKVMDYKVITALLFATCVVTFSIMPIFDLIAPSSSFTVYWEDGSPYKVVLPGMNASFNLTFEWKGGAGTGTVKEVIVETGRTGNWSISSTEVVIKPNEKKTITFTNYIPINATEGYYYFRYWRVGVTDQGITGFGGNSITTEVTLDMDYYNTSQPPSNKTFWKPSGDGARVSQCYDIFTPLIILPFFAWIVISIIFFKRRKES